MCLVITLLPAVLRRVLRGRWIIFMTLGVVMNRHLSRSAQDLGRNEKANSGTLIPWMTKATTKMGVMLNNWCRQKPGNQWKMYSAIILWGWRHFLLQLACSNALLSHSKAHAFKCLALKFCFWKTHSSWDIHPEQEKARTHKEPSYSSWWPWEMFVVVAQEV